MLRTFNYTGRRRIEQADASFQIDMPSGGPASFTAELRLDKEMYPDDASVYVDVWYKETRQRFSFGTVGQIAPPRSTVLETVELAEGIQFRVLVVDEAGTHALLLGTGIFRIAGQDPEDQDRRSLVLVRARDLGPLPWRVEFGEESRPTLCINSNIPNAIEKMRVDPVFQALILPSAMQEILGRILFSEDVDPDSEGFRQWLAFVLNFTDQHPDGIEEEERRRWIDEVVVEFCRRFDLVDRVSNVFREDD